MIEHMEQVHMTDAEVVDNFARVLEKLQRGLEVIVEHDHQPVAVIKAPQFRGRSIDDCISQAESRGSHETLDEDFGRDLEAVIQSHREPFAPPSWD